MADTNVTRPVYPGDAPHLAIVQKRLKAEVSGIVSVPGPPGPQGNPGPVGPQGVPGAGVLNYSAAEQNTGTLWIDGRHVYQKTVSTGAIAAPLTVAHGVPAIANIVRIWGWATDGTSFLPLPYTDGASFVNSVAVYADLTNIHLSGPRSPAITASYVTLHYTCTNR